MSYRDDVAALAARKAALDQQLRDLTRERDEAARLLEQVRLPVLPNMRVAAPCNASWDAMTGDDRARHCGECKQQVFNLSALTTEQAESLIREKHGDLCVRYYKRNDGTVLTADCRVGAKKLEGRRTIAASILGTSLFAAGIASAVGPPAPQIVEDHLNEDDFVMGKFETRTNCDVYVDQLRELAECAPVEGREQIRNAANQFEVSIHQVPPQAERQLQEACGEAITAIRPALDATCKPLEQRDEDRGHDREPEEPAQK
jgi:hypothetical protein